MEPKEPMPLQRGSCDFCGADTKEGRSYCGKECRVAYNNLLARQGKTVMQMLKVWRKHRGAKGTPGEGMIGEIANRVDAILEEDRARKKELRAMPAPSACSPR
jgi:predicted nucleic acid-binding Zn ribbon protein